MNFKSFVGIDVSKLTLDICFLDSNGKEKHSLIRNTTSALSKYFLKIKNNSELLICAEYTGHYSNVLKAFCLNNEYSLWLEDGAEIKLSSGVQRCKSDKIDASRIAQYSKRYIDKVKLQKPKDNIIEESKLLLTERESCILRIEQNTKRN